MDRAAIITAGLNIDHPYNSFAARLQERSREIAAEMSVRDARIISERFKAFYKFHRLPV